ncbi:DUF1002 domain-containing protein, partial [uncultured Campylobacter sp.]|uniref:DUF1002 domain-containing protein n=1 Tax=uncultured Campylobacter sp. TaxID=218934 RepID=UPI002614919F
GYDANKLNVALADIKAAVAKAKESKGELTEDDVRKIVEDTLKNYKLDQVVTGNQVNVIINFAFNLSKSDILNNEDFTKTLKQNIESTQIDHYKPHMANDMDLMQDVADMFQEYDLNVIAVTSSTGILLGRITYDDIHDYIQESATEQIYNLAGVDDESEEDDTLFKAGRGRAVWLGVNLLTALFSSSIIGLFDETIAAYVALAVLMPIVASMGGNTGTQALTVTVRRLALGEIAFKDKKQVLFREITIAFINGLIFATLMGFVAYFWFGIKLLGLVIAMSMVLNLTLAGLFGAVIPITLKKLNIDPAVGSSVLLTTVTDIVGFFSFLGLATWILL